MCQLSPTSSMKTRWLRLECHFLSVNSDFCQDIVSIIPSFPSLLFCIDEAQNNLSCYEKQQFFPSLKICNPLKNNNLQRTSNPQVARSNRAGVAKLQRDLQSHYKTADKAQKTAAAIIAVAGTVMNHAAMMVMKCARRTSLRTRASLRATGAGLAELSVPLFCFLLST